jgi:hypothetical protein
MWPSVNPKPSLKFLTAEYKREPLITGHKSREVVHSDNPENHEQRVSCVAVIIAMFGLLVVIVKKMALIGTAANGTPFYDQWDGEAAGLYKPWLEGTWTWQTFVASHNEHRILPTRVLHLTLFELLGHEWSPVLQMAVNALLHVLAIVVLVRFLASALLAAQAWPVWMFAAVLHAVPFGWDSALQGFNTHFYVLLLLTFALLWTCTAAHLGIRAYLGAVAMAVTLVLTMASGLLGPVAAALILLSRRVFCHDRSPTVGLAILLGGIAVGGYLLTPDIPGHHALRAQSLGEFALGLGRIQAWPLPTVGRNVASALMPVVMQMPALVALAVAFRNRAADRQAFLVFAGMTAWVWLQAAAFAYARYRSGLGSRYLDILCAGTVLNFTAVLYLLARSRGRPRTAVVGLAIVWLSAVAFGVVQAVPKLYREIQTKMAESKEQERRVREYLATGDAKVLLDAGPMEIPYPEAAKLQAFLDDPTIRGFLPAALLPAPAVNQ